MSSDSNARRSRVWKFTRILHTPLEQHATRVSAAPNMEPYDVLEQLFRSLILSTRIPSNAKFIQLRVPRVAFNVFESNARAGMRTRLLSEDVLTLHVLRLHLVSEDVFANEHGYV